MFVALGWVLLAGLPLPSSLSTTDAVAPIARRSAARRRAAWPCGPTGTIRTAGARAPGSISTPDEPAHVTVFRVDTDGRLRVLFPREPWGDTYVRDGAGVRGERRPRRPVVHRG